MEKCTNTNVYVFFPDATSHDHDAQLYHSSAVPVANRHNQISWRVLSMQLVFSNEIFINVRVIAWYSEKYILPT